MDAAMTIESFSASLKSEQAGSLIEALRQLVTVEPESVRLLKAKTESGWGGWSW